MAAYRPLWLLALFAITVCLLRPSIGVALVVLVEMTRLPLSLLGADSSSLTLTQGAIVYVSLLGALVLGQLHARMLFVTLLWLLAALGPAAVVAASTLQLPQMLAGLNLILIPVATFLVATTFDRTKRITLLNFTTVMMIINVGACALELQLGLDQLMAAGLEYGTHLRHIDGVLRAPGLMTGGIPLGMVAAALIVWALAERLLGDEARRTKPYWKTATAFSLIAMLLATSRSALVVLVIAALTLSIGNSRVRGALRWSPGVIAAGLVLGFVVYGLNSTSSLQERMLVWNDLLSQPVGIFGNGIGSVGAATYSSFSTTGGVFVDNYWLSSYLQLGSWGILVILIGALLLLNWSSRHRAAESTTTRTYVRAILLSLMAGALFIEIWEYTAFMLVTALSVGARLHHYGDTAEQPQESAANLKSVRV